MCHNSRIQPPLTRQRQSRILQFPQPVLVQRFLISFPTTFSPPSTFHTFIDTVSKFCGCGIVLSYPKVSMVEASCQKARESWVCGVTIYEKRRYKYHLAGR